MFSRASSFTCIRILRGNGHDAAAKNLAAGSLAGFTIRHLAEYVYDLAPVDAYRGQNSVDLLPHHG